MIIRASTLVNRFYKHDGWGFWSVFRLLHSVKGKSPPDVTDALVVEDRGEYYAVYDPQAVFDAEEVAQHIYEPYSDSECDRLFSDKNKTFSRKDKQP